MSASSSKLIGAGHERQQAFLENLDGQPFRLLFEGIPDVHFFAKDAESRMMCASKAILERFGLKSEEEIVGKTDYDFFPRHIADAFVRDDRQVMDTGLPIINRAEVWYNEQRLLDWYRTSKLPLRDQAGRIVGIMGTVQSYEGQRRLVLPLSQVQDAVTYIRANFGEKLMVDVIAARVGFSARQLHRRFQEVFGMNVRDFVLRTRINEASELLKSSDVPIAEVAIDCGFCDQSAFTAQFRKIMKMTPLAFRKRYRG